MADIKNLLKEARKLIDEKNFQEAQECCKNILRKDKQNYFALVLLGKSLQDSDQAPLAYQKAIASKRDHPLAWQGLANYYESKNNEVSNQKLLHIYKEMLSVPMEDEKVQEIIGKIGSLGISLKSSESINILADYISANDNEKFIQCAKSQLIDVLKADIPCQVDNIPMIQNILTQIYSKEQTETLEIIQCKIILQKNDVNAAIEEISNLNFFYNNSNVRELLCKWLCKEFIKNMSFNGLDIKKYVDKITNGIETSKYSELLKSILFYEEGNYQEAYKLCVPLVNYQETDEIDSIYITKCTMMLKKWSVTQKLAVNFINKAKTQHLATELRKCLFFSLAKQQKWKQAIANAKMIEVELLNIEEQACLVECCIEENEPFDHLMENLKSSEYYTQLKALALLKRGKYENVVDLLQEANNNSIFAFYLGVAHWELRNFDKCILNLLIAAKLNNEHAETFLYLGKYYYYYKYDLLKAKKCYEKAYSLNNMDNEIVKNLSEVYLKQQENNADFELLVSYTKNVSQTESWLHFRLGLHYLNRRDWENAIINFRNVIKSNQKDTTAFECLADAYYSRGSYTSALRAYNKVMTLDPTKTSHCLTRTGYIYSLLTQYQEAITTFEKVLEIDPHSYLALKGISETWMRLAKKKVAAKIFGTARDYAQHAIDYTFKAIKTQNQYTCFWKLLGDTLMFVTKLPDQYSYVYMAKSLNKESDIVRQVKLDIFPQVIAFYAYVAKFRNMTSSYDLAYVYYHYFQESQKRVNCRISFNLTTLCLKDKPTSWRNWNLLGKNCMSLKKYEHAQHCFIKALLVTKKISAAKIWCNLGTLYLKLKLYKLANYCFWRGQSTLPSYPHSWIGQALIAEVIREEEAMDLYRHASRLGYHPESALGYADWVCRTLKDNKYNEDSDAKYVIEGLHAVPYAMDLIEWFTTFEPNNACALNILGVLQEHSGLLKPAIKSYEKAFKYAEDNNKNIVLLNIGRILVRLEKYVDAVKIYKAITEASFNSTVGLALALFKNGLYEESYSVYDTALHWLCNNEDEKSDVLVAMAGIVYMFKGMDDAKTILFHSIQTSQNKPSPYCLFSVCALGLIHSEPSLTKLALNELRKYEKHSQYAYDIGFLKSYNCVIEENVNQGIKLLSESLHDHPSNALLWFVMAQYCLKIPESKSKVASRCAQKALCSTQFGDYNSELENILASASIAEHLAGDRIKALNLAKEGLHMYPNQPEIWAALLFSLLSHKAWTDKKTWLLSATSHMRKDFNLSRPLGRWVNLIEKKLSKNS